MDRSEVSRFENRLLVGVFVLALLYSLYAVTFHWTMGYMAGHEFRQAQTALISYYIDKDDNFSLLYETPVLGKPWVSILLEVPIYEWAVVGLSRMTGWAHVVSARTVSASCFYLTLPAIYLLLGRLSVSRPRRLLLIALVMTAPVYIYYSRAFLIDAMAFMASVWFLLGFVRTMDGRHWGWLLLTTLAGTLAALVKSATFAVWLLPAAGYGAWMLWRDWRKDGWLAAGKTVLWGVSTVVVALGLLRWWIKYTDPIKEAHPSAWIFSSTNLTMGNWGLFDPRPLFSKDLWGFLFNCWQQAIMWPWLIAVGLIAGLALPSVRWKVVAAGGLFFLAQFMFPFAYAYQDYYFYSCAVFVCLALGFTLLGLLDSRLPRGLIIVALIFPFAAQVRAYWQDYRKGQETWHHGGYPFTDAIRDLTPKNTVVIVAGADWAAMTPLYSQRKALMVRNGLEYDRAYLNRAFEDLRDEEVSAIIMFGDARKNEEFIRFATGYFETERVPTFSYAVADVYISKLYARGVRMQLLNSLSYPQLTLPLELKDPDQKVTLTKVAPAVAANAFPNITPAPFQVDFMFGVGWLPHGEIGSVLSSHPDSDIWLQPPSSATEIRWNYGIFEGAYTQAEGKTDGVDFSIVGERPDGSLRRIYRRLLDPATKLEDRGDQQVVIPYKPMPDEVLRFSTRPGGNPAYDWAYTISIKVQ